jgi:hypothetical protein
MSNPSRVPYVEPDPPMPEWAPKEGPWCVKQWLVFRPYGIVSTCLRRRGHRGPCRLIDGTYVKDGERCIGQLELKPDPPEFPRMAHQRGGTASRSLDVLRDEYGKPITITEDQMRAIWHAIDVVNRIRRENDVPSLYDAPAGFATEAYKSRLLGRILLYGRPPFDEKPPHAWGACDYSADPWCEGEPDE